MLVYVCVHVSAPKAINNKSQESTCNNTYKADFMASKFLYITLVLDELNERSLSNTMCHEHLPKKTKVTWYLLVTKELPSSTNKSQLSFIKVSGQMHSDAFKIRLDFHFTVIIST